MSEFECELCSGRDLVGEEKIEPAEALISTRVRRPNWTPKTGSADSCFQGPQTAFGPLPNLPSDCPVNLIKKLGPLAPQPAIAPGDKLGRNRTVTIALEATA